MSILPVYTHIVNKRLKHTYLSFDDEGNLVIKSPKVSSAYIEALLLKKSAWIRRSQEKLLQKKGKLPAFSEESRLYYKGHAYPLVMKQHEKKRCILHFDTECFTLSYARYDERLFRKQIDAFYRAEAKEEIPVLLEKWSAIMKLTYNQLSFRKAKRQWGSCSGKNNLSFNTMVMKLPPEVIEYIVVHELAHITHKHHQKAFWDCVAYYLPDYKARVALLKTFTT